jgi:hypothetical protein
MRIYPEQVKSSQIISRINLEHISNVLGAFYVHNEWIVMETSKMQNAGILFQTTQLGAWEALSDKVHLLLIYSDFLLKLSW